MPLLSVTSCRLTGPDDNSYDGYTGTASSVAFAASELPTSPTPVAIAQNDRVESPCKEQGCSGDGDKLEEGEKLVGDDCQDGCSSGSEIIKKSNAENTYEDECCSGAQRETSQDERQDGCCSGNKIVTGEACRNACCSSEDEKATEGAFQEGRYSGEKVKEIEAKYQDTCCSGGDEKAANENCQPECYSGETENSNRRRGVSACCEGKPTPCCDSMKCCYLQSRVYTDCSKLHASTESRFENAKVTAVKTTMAITLKQKVPPVHLTGSELVRNMERNWPPWIASVKSSLLSVKSLAVSPGENAPHATAVE